ncbi:hypothetical protein GCM10020000_84510 [Streptomyces olivoverticillatus]
MVAVPGLAILDPAADVALAVAELGRPAQVRAVDGGRVALRVLRQRRLADVRERGEGGQVGGEGVDGHGDAGRVGGGEFAQLPLPAEPWPVIRLHSPVSRQPEPGFARGAIHGGTR